jgi:hypothetical protein
MTRDADTTPPFLDHVPGIAHVVIAAVLEDDPDATWETALRTVAAWGIASPPPNCRPPTAPRSARTPCTVCVSTCV